MFVSCPQKIFVRFDEKQDLRICTVRDPDNLLSFNAGLTDLRHIGAAANLLDVTTTWMNAREEAASFSTS